VTAARFLLLLVSGVLLAACGVTPEVQAAIDTVREMEAQGRITPEQAAALVAGFESAAAYGIRDAVFDFLWAAGLYFGVMARRGPPERRARVAAARRSS